jgi:hypothetical protein
MSNVVSMMYVASNLLERTQVKGIPVQSTGEINWTTEERGWKRRMQKIASYGTS